MVGLIDATEPRLIHGRETVTQVKVPGRAQNLFKFQIVLDMMGIRKWPLGGGVESIDCKRPEKQKRICLKNFLWWAPSRQNSPKKLF
jgi:hypothetical protein